MFSDCGSKCDKGRLKSFRLLVENVAASVARCCSPCSQTLKRLTACYAGPPLTHIRDRVHLLLMKHGDSTNGDIERVSTSITSEDERGCIVIVADDSPASS